MGLSIAQDKTAVNAAQVGSIAATFDSAINEDDLMEASIFTRATNLTNPSGWTTDVNVVNSVELDVLRIVTKLAGASESTTVTFTQSPDDRSALHIREINGHDTTSPLDKTASVGRTNTVTTLSSGTTATLSQPDEICFAAFGMRLNITIPSLDNSYTLDEHLTAGAANHSTLISGHRIVSVTDAQQTDAAWGETRLAMGCIATYKRALESDAKVAVVSGPISSGAAGTADFTKAGFGTPKACIILLSWDVADDASPIAEGKISVGLSDFTLDVCITVQDEDGSAKVDCDSRKSNTKAYVLLDVAGAVDIDGGASVIADGVRLTNTTNASARAVFATVIMFGGADLVISLDRITTPNSIDGTQLVTTGIDQRLVFFIGADVAAEDSSSTGCNVSLGVASINVARDAFVNRCLGWAADHNNAVGSPSLVIRNDRCLKLLTEVGGDDWGIELTAATPTSYTVTERDVASGAGMEIYALALEPGDRKSKVGSVDSPISGATWTPSVALGFTPKYVGLVLSHAAVEGTIETDADAGGLGISSNTGPGEETCHSVYNEDAATTINANNLFRSRVIDLRDHDIATVIHDHSHLSFDSGGWTYTINTENETTAKKWFYWAIEEAPAAVADPYPAGYQSKIQVEPIRRY